MGIRFATYLVFVKIKVTTKIFAKMECISTAVRVSLPAYLKDLPIPNTFFGWFSLGIGDWARLLPFGVAVGGFSYLALQGLTKAPAVGPVLQDKLKKVPGFKPPRCNNSVKMECAKVVDTIDVEDMGDKGVFCRCWKSKKFPFCDGSHVKHNAETGDNTGPLIIKKSA